VSGHIRGKDGVYAAALLTEMVAVTGKKLSELMEIIRTEYGNRHMEECSMPFSPEIKESLLNRVIAMMSGCIAPFVYVLAAAGLLQGCLITLHGKTDGQEDNRIRFRDAAVTGYSLPSKGDVYHAQAAVRASRQLTPDGYNTYLAHVLYVHTPEKETYLMDEFDFDAHPLFMLGLLGNEYQLTAVRVGD
jgi:hypothetical protein